MNTKPWLDRDDVTEIIANLVDDIKLDFRSTIQEYLADNTDDRFNTLVYEELESRFPGHENDVREWWDYGALEDATLSASIDDNHCEVEEEAIAAVVAAFVLRVYGDSIFKQIRSHLPPTN
jgi:hypothetical protein